MSKSNVSRSSKICNLAVITGEGLGDADQDFEGRSPIKMGIPEGGVVDEDGFAVEKAGGPGGLEGVRGDFDVGGGVGGGADAAYYYNPTMIGSTGRR